ncbi:hypothetical protein H0A36_29060 [Endozoicomonas sp. SM1973]|uniref:Uncharacterized protein n=1 Tax=Spartinivicinus marinus TaxID=2994442 RepID=A0A853IAV1_9GAMM|nr:hypothetical protein [Spartinivicinus marinus]MCX4030429.1 hypothetical protein [Spartinivicinus marinus]NYZ70069.1 hypothetical protein [Spartinivicinus marinus]
MGNYGYNSEDTKSINLINKSLVEVLSEVEKRPLLWLSERNIQCLDSFLTGWFIGKGNQQKESDVLKGVQKFIEAKFKQTNTSLGWCDIIVSNVDPSETLDVFFSLFHEYIESPISK